MFNRMVEFLDKHNVLYEHQYGFRQNYSTEHALIQLSDKIAQAIDKKRFMIGIFVDLSKAFDTLKSWNLVEQTGTLRYQRYCKWLVSKLLN